jgi:hypothetical protein
MTKGIRAFALASGSAMTSGTAATIALPQYTEY